MSDQKLIDDKEELNVTAYFNELKVLKKNYKIYTNENKYSFSHDGSKLKHDLSIEGEKIVKEPKPTGGKKPKKDKDFNDLYNRLKADLTVYIDEKFDEFKDNNDKRHDESKQQIASLEKRFDEFKDENNKKHDESKQQIASLEKRFDEFKDENNKKHEESRVESQKQINALEERLNKKIDDRFDEILKAIKEKK
ncbi:hypothetical protein ACA758_04065 [Mycoplasmopsis agassizii]|uniref:hypothetical protein n=1 Tax=Mycoplasmopsis agassizii TaxID=33922 RepID=UPI003529C2FE